MAKKLKKYINREISWLAFNDRVLQEAEDETVPLIERLRFLGIYSNNQDEFFRVRVATMRRIARLGKKVKDFGSNPSKVLDKIQQIIVRQQGRFDNIYMQLMSELRNEGINVISEQELTASQGAWVYNYFHEQVRLHVYPIMVDAIKEFPTLRDTSIYLAVRLLNKKEPEATRYAMIEIPEDLPRFVELPQRANKRYIILMDDIIRFNLSRIFYIFRHDHAEAYTIKFTRDAELDIDDDVSLSYLSAIERSLKQRRLAEPVRLTYDSAMPRIFLEYLIRKMNLRPDEDAIIPGARYHNFKDFMSFPALERSDLLHSRPAPNAHPRLHAGESIFQAIHDKDVLLHFPYQSFNYILDFLREAAINPKVTEIHMTLYRAAENSAVIRTLISAARNGVAVTVVVELQARFDEEANIYWANRMREEGIRVIYGVDKLKVHAKLCLVRQVEGRKTNRYAIIGTGNFNENTAQVYSDIAVLTADNQLTTEVVKVFHFFERNYTLGSYRQLVLAPFHLRNRFTRIINREIANAKAGKEAWLFFKMNSLVDRKMIKKLYEASQAGVKVRLIVRGICSLVPGLPGLSENIEAISIVDKYLEHARIFIAGNDGKPEFFIGSADLMTRNLDFRVEVMTPINDPDCQSELMDVMEIQWKDNVKARVLDESRSNNFRKRVGRSRKVRAQKELYRYYREYLKTGCKPNVVRGAGPVQSVKRVATKASVKSATKVLTRSSKRASDKSALKGTSKRKPESAAKSTAKRSAKTASKRLSKTSNRAPAASRRKGTGSK